MQTAEQVPDFIRIVQNEDGTQAVLADPEEMTDASLWQVFLRVSLEDAEYQNDLAPLLHAFSVDVVYIDLEMTNRKPYPRVPLLDHVLQTGEGVKVFLWPEDEDDDAVTTELVVLN